MKTSIKNRKGLRIVVEVEEGSNGLAFVMHGLGASKTQPQVQTFAEEIGRAHV